MSESDRKAQDLRDGHANQPAAGKRIDAPHVRDERVAGAAVADDRRSGQDAPAAEGRSLLAPLEPSGGGPAASTLTGCQLHTQANQLAAHLRARQKDLDRREAGLNAGLAQLDNDARGARLWLVQRQEELQQRARALDERHRGLKRQLAKLTSERTAADRSRQESAAEQKQLRRRQAALDALAEQLAAQKEAQDATRLQHKQAEEGLEDRRRRIDARCEALQSRHQRLEQAEALLVAARQETDELRQKVAQDRRKLEGEARRERTRLAAQQRRETAELEARRRALQRRSEHVDRCRAALEKLREELGSLHRQTLEIRLATEELRAGLSGEAPPAALTRSLGRLRARLADQYRLANSELAEQKKELRSIGNQVSEQHQRLLQQKRHLDEWRAREQEEIQRQATRLAASQRELQRREAELDQQSRHWQTERLAYEQEIRRLRARGHDPPPSGLQ